MKNYTSLNEHLKQRFGDKVYKLALNGGMTCPNRDGTKGDRGCIFCSAGGSGDFAESGCLPILKQIELAKQRVSKKIKSGMYIAYFQAYTNTYAPVEYLEKIYTEAISHPDIVALAIATRPDCLPDDIIDLIGRLNRIKPIWVELGLQTIHQRTANYIRRGYTLDVYDSAVERLTKHSIEVVTHVIIGLPGESEDDMLSTVKYVCSGGISGIKLQLLHVLKDTDLELEYRAGKFEVLTMQRYIEIIRKCVQVIPKSVVIHRLTGDGAKKDLIAPLWSANKKLVISELAKVLEQ